MGSTRFLLCFSFLLAFSCPIKAYNITRLLGQFPEFGMFNRYITDNNLAGDINRRGTVTVLAVDDSTLSSISSRSKEAIKAIISTHIILDYLDEKKLMNIQNDSTTLTTLYQSSGIANYNQGFILAYNAGGRHFYFGSAVKGAPLNSQFVKTVVTQPYHISVLQVSQPIIPPGIDAQSPWPAPGARTVFPKKQDGGDGFSGSPAGTPSDDGAAADAPSGDDGATASSPSPSSAPVAAPTGAPAPANESAADDGGDLSSSSSSTSIKMGLVGIVMAFVSLLVALL